MYVMSYFRTEAEALHLAVSDDGLRWRPLNDNRPVWSSLVGKKSVRDPFVLRSESGKFVLLSTNGWQADSILVAESDDLLHWENARLAPIMRGIDGVRNCWAPEAFWDREERLWRVIWSSSVTGPAPGDETHNWDHRIWSAATRDFREFSEPWLFFDPGYSVIDATVVSHRMAAGGDVYLMAYKDERGKNVRDNPGKRIKTCTSSHATGPWTNHSVFLTTLLSEGPALFERDDADLGRGWTMLFDHFLDGRFGALHSADAVTWTDISVRVTFPPGPRHAGVLKVDDTTARMLL